MESDPRRVIDKIGFVKKHEFVRIIIQSLLQLGYRNSAACLELESGISYKSVDLKLLDSQVLEGDWNGCVNTVNLMEEIVDETRASALFLVFKQCLLECSSRGNDLTALAILTAFDIRKKLLIELEKLFPPPIVLPERRLEHLVETAITAQIDSCLYHNSLEGVSPYEDCNFSVNY